MKTAYDFITIGCGGLGSAAAYWLSCQAHGEVLALEQFQLCHPRGGSDDHSRIIRLAYDAPQFTALAPYAYTAWRQVEAESGIPLILKTGGLILGQMDTELGPTIENYARAMRDQGIPFREFSPPEVMERWPQFRLPDTVRTLYQADTGLVDARRANATHLALARANGATILDDTRVLGVRTVGDSVEVQTSRGAFTAGRVVIAAGAWTNTILESLGVQLPITVTQQQVTYFATPHLRDFAPDRFPVWMWRGHENFYGFPVYGEVATKAAHTKLNDVVTVDTRTFEPNQAALERLQRFLAQHIPGALGPVLYTKTCLYDSTPDENFVLDTVPDAPQVVVGLGAAHAYKFAGLIGRILSQLAVDGQTPYPIESFTIDRPALKSLAPASA